MSEESSEGSARTTTAPRGWGVISGTIWAALAFFAPRLVVSPVYQFLTSTALSSDAQIFILEAIIDVLIFGALVVVVKAYGLSLASIGLAKQVKPIYLGMALLVLPLYFIGSIVAVRITSLLFHIDVNAQQKIGFTATQGPALILVFIALVIIPPIVEEMVFRGFLLRAYQRRLGVVVGSIVVSLLFASLHAPVVVSVDVFVLSLFLCYLRIKTDSLWPSIFLHALKNFVAFLYLFIIGVK